MLPSSRLGTGSVQYSTVQYSTVLSTIKAYNMYQPCHRVLWIKAYNGYHSTVQYSTNTPVGAPHGALHLMVEVLCSEWRAAPHYDGVASGWRGGGIEEWKETKNLISLLLANTKSYTSQLTQWWVITMVLD